MTTIAELTEQVTLAETKVSTLATQLKDATTKAAKLELALGEEKTGREKDAEELKTLRDFKKTTEETALSVRVDEAFDTYKDKKGLTDSSKKSMLIVLKADAEQFEKDYPKVRADQRHLMRTLVKDEVRTSQSLPRVVAEGAPVVQMSERNLADAALALAAEKNITLEAAQDLVLSGVSR